MKYIFASLVSSIPMVLVFILYFSRQHSSVHKIRRVIYGFTTVNIIIILAVIGLVITGLVLPGPVQAQGNPQENQPQDRNALAYIGAALAVSLGAIGAGYAVAHVGSAAVGAIAEKPEVFGRALIFVGLAEGVAIYGLIIAFIILR